MTTWSKNHADGRLVGRFHRRHQIPIRQHTGLTIKECRSRIDVSTWFNRIDRCQSSEVLNLKRTEVEHSSALASVLSMLVTSFFCDKNKSRAKLKWLTYSLIFTHQCEKKGRSSSLESWAKGQVADELINEGCIVIVKGKRQRVRETSSALWWFVYDGTIRHFIWHDSTTTITEEWLRRGSTSIGSSLVILGNHC